MSNPAVAAEMQASFERDRQSFDGLTPREQKAAAIIAGIGFGTRQGVVSVGGLVVDIVEGAFNLVVRAPLAFAWKMTTKLADNTASAPVRIATAAARGGLGIAKGAVWLAGQGAELLRKAGIGADTRAKVAAAQDKLSEMRQRVAHWGKTRQEKTAKDWTGKKRRIRKALLKVGGFLEYHGAIGLYRGFKWLLDPRRPSGKPLLGNEKINKAVGFVAAVAMFGLLSYEVSKIIVLGKIMHYKLAHSLIGNTAPLWVKVLQQSVLHPAITVGLMGLKFVSLPVIAAARHRMKNYDFTQGVAYAYNSMLRDHRARELQREEDRNAKNTVKQDDTKLRAAAKKTGEALHKKSFSFIRNFFYHIIEKASPEFYDVRLRHYTEIRAEQKKAREERRQKKAIIPIPVPQPQPAIQGPLAGNAPGLAETFTEAQKPAVTLAPPVIAPPAPAPV